MSSEHAFEHKGKVQPKPSQETAEPKKEQAPLTKSQVESGLDAETLTRMQQTVGNAAVQRFLAQRQAEEGPSEVEDDTAGAIRSKRGSGQSLDGDIAAKAGGVMGQDLGDVRVHTDSQSDNLNQQLGAKAFTTGNDIFFRSGAYDPGSSDGQRLIAHELTHVVQQGASPPAVQGKMTVNDPNDQYEAEADKVADVVMSQPDDAVQRQPIEEEEEMLQPHLDDSVQREEKPEEEMQMQEEEEVQMQEEEELQLQEEEEVQMQEEEEVQMQEEEELQMQPEEEEEEEAVQMQEEEEEGEEIVMTKADPSLNQRGPQS
jgi:hypothetical protein